MLCVRKINNHLKRILCKFTFFFFCISCRNHVFLNNVSEVIIIIGGWHIDVRAHSDLGGGGGGGGGR